MGNFDSEWSCSLINKFKKKITKAKTKNIIKSTLHLESLINDPNTKVDKVFWDTINKITNVREDYIPALRDENTNEVIATTTEEIADELHYHFIKPLKRNKYEQKHLNYHKRVNDFINDYSKNNNNANSIVNRPYTKQEVLHVINTMNKNSAMAFDFIHYKLIFWAKDTIVDSLVLLFNYVL